MTNEATPAEATPAKSNGELFEIGFQDGIYHARNATDQTTSAERNSTPYYEDGYLAGRKERRAYLKSIGKQK